MAKPEPTTVNVGSLSEAWKNIGRVTIANAGAITPFKESDLDNATAGSLLKYELAKAAMALMLRARLAIQSGSVTIQIRAAKNEDNTNPLTGIAGSTVFEKFYADFITVTFTTSGGAVAAERGGFYADGFSIDDDNSLKGIGSFNKDAIVTFVDVLGQPNHALICTVITGAWAEFDVTNS